MRRTTVVVIAVVILAAVLTLGVAAVSTHTSGAAEENVPVAGPTAGTSAYEYMAELSDELGARVAGLSPEAHAGDRILEWFGDLGYTPDTQDFTFAEGDKTRHSRNIVAVKPGVSGKQIVIGAHYDSIAAGRGAFDNASGVALMMELADALRDENTPYTLVFVAFGAEEAGMHGSAWPQLALRSMARSLGITILTSPGLNKDYAYGTTGDWSDHVAFDKAGIPFLYVEATNWLLGDKDGYQNTVKDREIWQSEKDTLSYIEQRYPGRLEHQLDEEFTALAAFLTDYEIPAL
jgi:alkaline phosphatase isozyme conversion protein